MRQLLGLLLAFMFIIQPLGKTGIHAAASDKYVTVCIERFTLGQGYFIEPTLVKIEDGDTAADALLNLFNMYNVQYRNTGSVEEGTFYLQSIKDADTGKLNIPAFITEHDGPSNTDNDGNDDDYLGEFDYSMMSGWMITVNNSMIDVGSAAYEVHDQDVIRWAFTLWGYGTDLGYSSDWSGPAYYNEPDRTDLVRNISIAKQKGTRFLRLCRSVYNNALATASNVYATQEEVNRANAKLAQKLGSSSSNSVQSNASSVNDSKNENSLTELKYSIDEATDKVSRYLLDNVKNPGCGSIGGEWAVLQLARSGNITADFRKTYLDNLSAYVKNKEGVLSSNKNTEYSRVIIALSALNVDPSDFAGYNLLKPLADFNTTVKQGINGAIYALIALDTKNYVIPEAPEGAKQTTREELISYILDRKLEGGGWTLSGTKADPDITAMAIQSLALYYDSNIEVREAVDEAFDKLSSLQEADGGFSSWGTTNSESVAQVICALTSIGFDPAEEEGFIKENGSWLLSNLFSFAVEAGEGLAFAHTGSTANAMATEQAGYALVSYNRLLKGENSLYDMVEEVTPPQEDEKEKLSVGMAALKLPEFIENKKNAQFNIVLRAGSYSDNAKMLDGCISLGENVEVTEVTMSTNISGGVLNWNMDGQILRFVYGDLNKGSALKIADESQEDVMTIHCRMKSVVKGQDKIAFGLSSFRQIESSEKVVEYDVLEPVSEVNLVQLSVYASLLYEGDGTDIIPTGKKAVRVDIAGVELGDYEIDFSINSEKYSKLYISKDFTTYLGHTTYVMIVDSNITDEQLNDINNYSCFEDTKASQLQFGDTNNDGVIDAQDALNEVSLWLRKVQKDITSDTILTYNVNGDGHIDSMDALSIVEAFISSKQFGVMN